MFEIRHHTDLMIEPKKPCAGVLKAICLLKQDNLPEEKEPRRDEGPER